MNRYRVAALKPKLDGCVKLAARSVQFCDRYLPDFSSRFVTFLNARSAPASVSSASASRAASMNRLDCSGSSFGRSFLAMHGSIAHYRSRFLPRRLNGNSSCSGALGFHGAVRYLIRQTLSGEAFERDIGALFVIVAQLGAGVLAKIELRQIAVKVFAIDVLIHADKAALQNRKEAFQSVGMHVAARPFELGMIDKLVACDRREFVVGGAVRNKTAILVHVLANDAHGAAVIQHRRSDIAATSTRLITTGLCRRRRCGNQSIFLSEGVNLTASVTVALGMAV
jgi:hypothetical protein